MILNAIVSSPFTGETREENLMICHGRVKNGVVVLDDPTALPEETEVNVTPVRSAQETEPSGESLGKRLLKFAGTVQGLPGDMAEQHDHYIHGTPKR